jgi:thioredoxin-dependent peroxiredoxin
MLRIVLLGIVVGVIVRLVSRLLSGSKLPPVGSVAPEFALLAQDGSRVTLRDYRGRWVVLYFYPKDHTPG